MRSAELESMSVAKVARLVRRGRARPERSFSGALDVHGPSDHYDPNRRRFERTGSGLYSKTTPQLDHDFHGKRVWMLINVELWMREFID